MPEEFDDFEEVEDIDPNAEGSRVNQAANKKSNVVPFRKRASNENKSKKDSSAKDKLGKKNNVVPFRRRNGANNEESSNGEQSGLSDNKGGLTDNKGGLTGKNEGLSEKGGLTDKKTGLKTNTKTKGSLKSKIADKFLSNRKKTGSPADVLADKIKKIVNLVRRVTILGPIVLGISLVFFVIYIILSPLMDIWPYIDEGARSAANFTEKFVNFFRGFGFEDSKQAFYDEANALSDWYDGKLDMPLLLSTLYYPEIQDYDKRYENHLAADEGDPVTSLLSGGPEGFVDFLTGWVKDIVSETTDTYDENGLVYNANKIFRMRRLAAAMAEIDETKEEEVSLGVFLERMGSKLSKAFKDLIMAIPNFVLTIITESIKLAVNVTMDLVRGALTFNFERMANDIKDDFKQCFQSIKDSGGNVILAIEQFINLFAFGFCSITSISFNIFGVTNSIKDLTEEQVNEKINEVTNMDESTSKSNLNKITVKYRPFTFNKDKYDEYLMKYYFEDTIEYADMLPANPDKREETKKKILAEIYETKKTFEDMFIEKEEGTGEKYVDNCSGAIDNKIVKQMTLPIDKPASGTFNFSQSDLYGIKDGLKQNGVLLTSSNSGITAGSNVYSVYDGTVLEVHHTNDTITGTSYGASTGVGTGNTINRTYNYSEDDYRALASQAIAEQGESGVRFEITQMVNLYEKKGKSYKTLREYIENSTWYSCSKLHMNPDCAGKGCYCESNGKTIVYKYTDEAVAVVKDVLENGKRIFPSYITEHDSLSDIVWIEVNGNTYSDRDSIRNKSLYIQDVTKVYTKSTTKGGAKDYWIFYSYPEGADDPFGYYPRDKENAQNSVEEVNEDNSNWVVIEHYVDTQEINNNSNSVDYRNSVYTVYKYLGSITDNLKVGDHVSKGQVIGTVGQVNAAISSSSSDLVGDTLAERIWWALIDAGYSKEAAAGVIGNIAAETSNGDIDAINIKSTEKGKSFDEIMNSGLGFGLNGWTWYEFKDAFKAYLAHVGGNWYDEKVQIGFMIETIKANTKTSENLWERKIWSDRKQDTSGYVGNYTYEKFKNATTPEDAAFNFCGVYENPTAGCGPAPGSSSKENGRQTAAKTAYARFKDKTRPSSQTSSNVSSQVGIYFEYQNNEHIPSNPNNLFIKCAGAYDVIWPGSNNYISDLFGDRSYEVTNRLGGYGDCATKSHQGLDIAEKGSFYAVSAGTITTISKTGVHTISLKLDEKDENGNDIYVDYLHGDINPNLSVGSHLETGELVGTANSHGGNYGIHLHLQVRTIENGQTYYHNPLIFLYGLTYDGTSDYQMTIDIPKFDGGSLENNAIKFWSVNNNRPESKYFKYIKSTVGAYVGSICDYKDAKYWTDETKN